MRLLLDTHILVWFATARTGLSARERTALEDASQLLVSAISIWEIRAKVRSKRRRDKPVLTLDPASAVTFCERMQIEVDPATIDDLLLPSVAPDPPHGDMFDDRLLVHARRLGVKLLTRDRKLVGHPLAY